MEEKKENVSVETQKSTVKEADTPKGKKSKKKLFIGIGVALALVLVAFIAIVAVVIIAIVIISSSKPSIDLANYVSIEVSGCEGYANAEYVIDRDAFIFDNKDNVEFTKKFMKELENDPASRMLLPKDLYNLPEGYEAEHLLEQVDKYISVSQSTGLSNGDTVMISWSPDLDGEIKKRLEELYGVKIENGEVALVVEGLQEVPTFDPFYEYTLSIEGFNGFGIATGSFDTRKGIKYTINPVSGLSNGDVVKVVASYDGSKSDADYISVYGIRPSVWEREYTVNSLYTLVQSLDEISEEELTDMHIQASELITESTTEWIDGYQIDVKYVGNCIGLENDSNLVSLIYKIDYTNDFTDYRGKTHTYQTSYFYFVRWKDLKISSHGNLVYDKNDYIKSNGKTEFDTGIDISRIEKLRLTFTGSATWEDVIKESKRELTVLDRYEFVENIVEE